MVMSRTIAACLLLMVLVEDSQQYYYDRYLGKEDDSSCGPDSIRCPSSSGCISHSDLCNDMWDCSEGEDEEAAWCALYRVDSGVCDEGSVWCGSEYSEYDDCVTWSQACSAICSTKQSPDVCTAIQNGVLPATAVEEKPEPVLPQIAPHTVSVTKELVSFMSAANCSLEKISASTNQTSSCPQLYISIGKSCLAMLPFAVTWPDALLACRSISGKLLEVESFDFFAKVIQFLVKADFSSNFWIGGFFDIEKENWSWSSGPKMPRTTPYWAVKHNSTCATRQSPKLGALPGCSHYQQAPTSQGAGYCAALQFELLYYISDEGCYQKKQPLCIH